MPRKRPTKITKGIVEPEQLRLIFERFEGLDGDGQMGYDDFAKLLLDLGITLSDNEADHLFTHLLEASTMAGHHVVRDDGAASQSKPRLGWRRWSVPAAGAKPLRESPEDREHPLAPFHSGPRTINVQEFLAGLRRHCFLRRIVSHYTFNEPASWAVPADYDYGRSTRENYGAPLGAGHEGSLAELRAGLDEEYHGNYTAERQRWQDAAIHAVALPGAGLQPCVGGGPSRGAAAARKACALLAGDSDAAKGDEGGDLAAPEARPWLVYTCGAMGSGKGWVMNWMSQRDIFPLRRIVHVDPDRFKTMMPEWAGYLRRDAATAGTLCHAESGLLAELTQELAMRQRQHVWVDGSLRDFQWYDQKLAGLRRNFPHYRVALFYIHAPEATVRARVRARAQRAGGRDIPDEVLAESLAAPAHTLRALTPRLDFIARILNLDDGPVLEALESVDHSGSWAGIAEKFSGAPPPPQCPAKAPRGRGL
ncbi:zeta toxin-domain-containing protein [Pelagophyceae sp. CCMP2097]|nr:zeta toxin-domain-containing protein [Pelagophyceae sp. CCMP2097]